MDPMTTSREFAIDVVRQLQTANYTALWAGGCVRDQLLGKTPKDYDVATNATPDEVRNLFGKRRTLPIGASFGVITVLGPKSADPIEVATFRRDTGYSDGRRPDSVEFTDAREDAIRRDFTINGMFYDPITDSVIDYVGGQEDLEKQVIRAIGNPHERIEEDKLRMLRAIRFASTFRFKLEPDTMSAVRQHAREINVVSGERIGAELRRMLSHSNRAVAAKLLRESQLLKQILPGSETIEEDVWNRRLDTLAALEVDDFACATAVLVSPLNHANIVQQISQDWKISNDEKKTIAWILSHLPQFTRVTALPWSVIQPLLIQPDAQATVDVLQAEGQWASEVKWCRERLAWPTDRLNPPPFLTGDELKELGFSPGPTFGITLKELRAKQLDGEINSKEQATQWVMQS